MLYLRGRSGLLMRGGTLQQKIEVCGQQLVSPGGDHQIAALSKIVAHLSLSAYYHCQSTLMGIDGNRTRDLSHS